MDPLIIAGCVFVALLCCTIIFWQICCRCFSKKRSTPDRSLLISDFLQPVMICKSVPCQHPYYRVISEYHSKTYDKMPGIQEAADETNHETDTYSRNQSSKWDSDLKKKLSLASLPRYSSITNSSRKQSLASVGSSRRSSDSGTSSVPISPVYKTKPIQVTQVDVVQT